MTSYFDEHDCIPLARGETPNHQLQLARLLLDSGLGAEWDMGFSQMFGQEDQPPPPASAEVIKNLPEVKELKSDKDKCPICIAEMNLPAATEREVVKELPCGHQFHGTCVIAWLKMVNTCPLCKFELPTDDALYEELKKQKKRHKERKAAIDELHNSMFA